MIPFGKTYLIKAEEIESITNDGGIFVVSSTDRIVDGFWKGTVVGYGTLVTEKEKEELAKIGDKIIMTYGKDTSDKGGVKIVLNKSVYYIRTLENVLGVLENE